MEELIAKYFSGEATAEERQQVAEWRAANEENASAFLTYKQVWLESGPAEADQEVLSAILNDEPTQPPKVIPLWNQKLFRIAAVLVLAMGVIFTILTLTKEQPYGQVLEVKTTFDLPDGSEVIVQRGGFLAIGDFKDRREVTLTGKAYFEVDRDKNRPFVVKTKGALIEVMGTSFVVRSFEEDPVTEVLVSSGTVAMSQNPEAFSGKSIRIELEGGEMGELEIGKRGIRKRKITDENYLSWKTSVITFRRNSLREVSAVMEDVYGVKYAFENPALTNCKLTASFNKKSADEVAAIIAETFNFTYTREGDVITFSGTSCK